MKLISKFAAFVQITLVLTFVNKNEVCAKMTDNESEPVRVRFDTTFLNAVYQEGSSSLNNMFIHAKIDDFSFETTAGLATASETIISYYVGKDSNSVNELVFNKE